MTAEADPRGSIWRRWDPHIHTPGTVLNNQFGNDAWDAYLTAIETASPQIEVLGVTDYASLDRYEEVLKHKADGRLSDVALIFPNVELRFPLLTAAGKPVNMHLLISPEDADHVERARSFLKKLKFEYQGEPYVCERADLIRLGRKHKGPEVAESVALEAGTNQFKVTPQALRDAMKESVWAQENILIGVAGSSRDGSSGLRDPDGSLEATRVEIEAMSNVVFTSQPTQRDFWLGRGAATLEEIENKWRGRKACLHGSDAHELATVGKPDDARYTWIKGDATFETLRQACIEPAERVIVDTRPPSGPLEYRTISGFEAVAAPWLATPAIPLNRGLVAIIGARGSGKTALADLIAAAAASATPDRTSDKSFVRRAASLLGGSVAKLDWADGAKSSTPLPPQPTSEPPAVQYLSQQFVDQLCSAEGITDELLGEIERVVFEAHADEGRMGSGTFDELLDIVASPSRDKRTRAHEENAKIAALLDAEREARDSLPGLTIQKKNLEDALASDKTARGALIVSGGADRATRLEELNAAVAAARLQVDSLNRRVTSLTALQAEAADLTSRQFVEIAAALERKHSDAALTPDQWAKFGIAFKTDPQPLIVAEIEATNKRLSALIGPKISQPTEPASSLPPFVPDGADLKAATSNALRAEAWRLGELIGLDSANAQKLSALNAKIGNSEAELERLTAKITKASAAEGNIKSLIARRTKNYAELFDGFAEEEARLADLYAPVKALLAKEAGSLGKLSFTVRRSVDAEAWALRGELLLDLRTSGTFRGKGELLRFVEDELVPAWKTGSSADVSAAMASFRAAHDQHLVDHANVDKSDVVAFRRWGAQISEWLNSTDHIAIRYGVQYDGVDIEQLSPGTRGIVLLLLYLSLDQTDDRPLIIDQPEENLDPKSIFDELVDRFRATRQRRQIIIVTHNANLVVNTDADQVIIAKVGAHRPGTLPEITYTSGGLENREIREEVCEILEGGKRAFRERARRLRFKVE